LAGRGAPAIVLGLVRARLHSLRRAAVGLALASACSFNPATGRLQLTTISDAQEVALGRDNDAQVVEALGLYDDEGLATVVSEVGGQLAGKTERPGLPWTFRVLDDPTVNAFALPGGYVYVTRGLLVHLGSKDELAAVLGHEIGHVTARHGVVQLRKTKVAAASVGVFRVIDPNLRHVGGIAAGTAGLALLKHGRDDELEADGLGLRYAGQAGYEPAAALTVFDVLVGTGRVEADGRVPTWLSTHPDPEVRQARIRTLVTGEPPGPDPAYLALLDGVIYGEDPRDGMLVGRTFAHPRQGFAIDLPEGWKATHEGPQVMAVSPDEVALLVLTPTQAESAAKGLEAFFADGSITRGEAWDGKVGGFGVASAGFSMSTSDGGLSGLLAFIDYDEDTVMALAAVGPAAGWAERLPAVAEAFGSFRRAERALREVEPRRVRLYALPEATTLLGVQDRRPSSIDLPRLALLNAISDPTASLPAGTVIKRVEGGPPPATSEAGAGAEPSTPPAADTPR
jgi:predicted Zn-dependent protease